MRSISARPAGILFRYAGVGRLADDGPFRERFRREVAAAGRVNALFTVTVISAATATVAATVPVGVSPVALAVAPDSSRGYVVDGTADTVTLLQPP